VRSSENDAASAYLMQKMNVAGSFNFSNQSGPAFLNESVSKDCYIYCTTNVFDEANLSKMGGACVEIIDPPAFFCLIDEELSKRGLIECRHETAACIYGSKTEIFFKDRPGKPAGWKLKTKTYAHQNEVRTMWVPTKETDLQGTLKSSFVKYVTLHAEIVEVEALVGKNCFRRLR
jgi:hypothetical protein